MMKTVMTLALATLACSCWSGDGDPCTNECECRAAVNRCIGEAAEDVRARAATDGAHFRDRAAVLEAQVRPFSVPEDPTLEELSACEDARLAHIEALRSFPELADCETADRW